MFTSITEAKTYLIQNRTSEAISAYLTEGYFRNRYLNNVDYSQGWYFDCNNDKLQAFVLKQKLNETDKEFANQLGITHIWQVFFAHNDIVIKDYSSTVEETIEEYVTQHQLTRYPRPTLRNGDEAEQNKRESYCNYLIQNGSILEVANTALIEDGFLNSYFRISDVDFVIKNDLGCIALDIKFKYPSRNGSYGINVGPFSLFGKLEERMVRVYNIILKNTSNDMDCLMYMNQNNPTTLYAYVDTSGDHDVKKSPSKCSYFHDTAQQYIEISGSKYKPLNLNGNIFDLRCPVCGGEMIQRVSKYGAFLGCKQFGPGTGCKGTITI